MSGISWTVLAGFLRALAVFATGKHASELQGVLNVAATLLERGEAGRHELEKLCAEIDVMVAQGREPTAEEWARLRDRSDAAHASIQAATAASGAVGDTSGEAPDDSEGGSKD